MCRLTIALLALIALMAMACLTSPTTAPTQTPDLRATIQAGIEATLEAGIEPTPTLGVIPPITEFLTPTVVSMPSSPTPTGTPVPTSGPNLAILIQQARPSVVRVETNLGTGSEVIFEIDLSERSALALTNYHVIEGSSGVSVTVKDRDRYSASVLGIDPLRDLAVLRICCSDDFTSLDLGDADSLLPGMTVVAMGYPLGIEGEATVTTGIVSAKRYEGEADRWVIQTDAPINPGNSGGPLLSLSGQVVGINTFKLVSTEIEGVGFAVSEATISVHLPDLKSGTLVTLPTPTPSPSGESGTYVSDKYWYSIDIPDTWRLDAGDEDAVAIWDPKTAATVWIAFEEIDPERYPTLDSYVDRWEPAEAEAWADFQISSEDRVGLGSPVEAQEYLYSFVEDGQPSRGVTRWYILGIYWVRVDAIADEAVWADETYSISRDAILETLESFQPSSYVSSQYRYSLAHPAGWEPLDDPDVDYWASDPVSGSLQVYVQIDSATGYNNVAKYGQDHTIIDSDIISKGLVFSDRPNPSYRIDYRSDEDTNQTVRGVALITLSGNNAIWIFVEDYQENWVEVESLLDEVLIRAAIVP